MLRSLIEEETKHRERLARLAQLRRVVAAQDNREQLAEVDALERLEQTRYREFLAAGGRAVGEERFERLRNRMAELERARAQGNTRPGTPVRGGDAPTRGTDTPARGTETPQRGTDTPQRGQDPTRGTPPAQERPGATRGGGQ